MILFPAVVPTSSSIRHIDSTCILNLAKLISFSTVGTNVAFMDRPTYKIVVTYSKSIKTIHATVALPDVIAGASLIHSALISPWWRNGVKKETLPKLGTVTKRPR